MTIADVIEMTRFRAVPGAHAEFLSDWQESANGWRITLEYDGRRYSCDYWQGSAVIAAPDAASVLECLLLDASAPRDFAEFVDEYGLTDPAAARRAHRACMRCAERLAYLFGDSWEDVRYATY